MQDLNRTTQLTAANGRKVDALTVFSLSLKYMKDKAVEFVRENTGDRGYNEKDIQWVLTVPAIWTPAAKQFMREAAYQVRWCKVNCYPKFAWSFIDFLVII